MAHVRYMNQHQQLNWPVRVCTIILYIFIQHYPALPKYEWRTNCSANRSRSMAMFHGTCAFIPLSYVLCVKSWLHISGEEKQFQYCLTRQLSQILQLNPHSKSGLTSHSEPECDDYSCYILMLMFCFSKLAHDLENKEKLFKMQKRLWAIYLDTRHDNLILNVLYFLKLCHIFDLQNQKEPKA